MNYDNLNKLLKECIKYMSPETDWRFIHADCYTLYSHTGSILYSSSFPLWKELKHTIFNDIREVTGQEDAMITNLTVVNCNKYTVCHPCPTYSGMFTLSAAGAYAAIRQGDSEDKSRKTAHRAMFLHSPHLMNWQDSDSMGFYVGEQKHLFPGDRIFNYYPKEGTQFIYFNIDNSYTRFGKKKDE